MKSIQDCREARNAKAQEIHALSAKDKLTSAEATQLDTLYGEVEEIDARIARINKSNALAAASALAGDVAERVAGIGHNSRSDDVRAFAIFLQKSPQALTADDLVLIRQTMSTTTQTEGGYTVPTEVAAKLLVAMKKFGAMRACATVLNTATGGPLSFPAADPTSEVGEIVAENATTSALDTSFSTIALPAYMYSSKSVAVPLQLLQDSIIDIEAYVLGLLAMRLGRITSLHYTVGTGVNQPFGILTQASVGYAAANGTSQVLAVVGDSLIELFHSVDPAYRELNNTAFMFNDTTLKVIRKLKDNNARYMFLPGFEQGPPGGVPDSLLGQKIVVNQQMPNMAASAKSILFGDFSFYTIRDAMDVLIRRFDDSAFALKGQVGFCAWMRSGGNLIDIGGAVKAYQNAAS